MVVIGFDDGCDFRLQSISGTVEVNGSQHGSLTKTMEKELLWQLTMSKFGLLMLHGNRRYISSLF